jgi:MFS transporter, OPA family, glycerol-3-phosphate transporter
MRTLRLHQAGVVCLLFGGYAALYFCRADLSVGTPLLDAAIVRTGTMASLGVLAYALGKLFLAGLGDFWGGRRNFLIGLAGAAAFTVLFAAAGTLPVLTFAWIGNRLTQSGAWAGLIKVTSKWFDHATHGTIIGLLSISYNSHTSVAFS